MANRQIGWSQESNLLWQIGNQIDRFEKVIFTSLSNTVPSSRTLTINGVTYDLSADRSWTVSGGIGGTIATGQVAFASALNTVAGSNNLFWDAANSRLGIGTSSPVAKLHVDDGSGAALFVGLSTNIYYRAFEHIWQGINGTVERMQINQLGNLLLGTSVGNGSRLQVQGDASVSGVFRETITTNRQNASYTLVLTDNGKLIEMNVATANNLAVPLNSTIAFPVGTKIDCTQYGAGQTTIVANPGVTINSAGGALKLRLQYSGGTLVKIATNEWYLFGDITT